MTIVFNIRYSAFNIRNIYTYSRYAHSINAKMGYCTSEECTWYQVYIHRSQLIDRTAAGSLELLVGNSAVVQQVSYSVPDIRCAVFIFDIRYWYSMLDILYSMFDNRRLLSDTCSRCSKKILKLTLLVKEIRIGQTNTSTKSMVRLPLSQMENSDVLNHSSYIVLETAIHCSRRVKC